MDKPIRLAILGSGNGTNAQQISEYFAGRTDVVVACIIYNKRDAYIAERAKKLGIESRYFGRADFCSGPTSCFGGHHEFGERASGVQAGSSKAIQKAFWCH